MEYKVEEILYKSANKKNDIYAEIFSPIDASKIIAKSITSDKLVISSSDNLIEEPLFDAGGLGWILSPSSVYSASSGELNTNGITVEGGPTLVNNYENIGFSSRTASGSKSFKLRPTLPFSGSSSTIFTSTVSPTAKTSDAFLTLAQDKRLR